MLSKKCKRNLNQKMQDGHDKLLFLLERKVSILREQNPLYAKFKQDNPLSSIREIISRKDTSREDIIDLGILLHLHALHLRLSLYEQLSPFPELDFENDLQELINTLHVYEKHTSNKRDTPAVYRNTADVLIPPFTENEINVTFVDNNVLYDQICSMLGMSSQAFPVTIPDNVIRKMQDMDKKKIYCMLLAVIQKEKTSSVRQLENYFPVFENRKLGLAVIFSEVLYLANEGKIRVRQMTDDIGVESI